MSIEGILSSFGPNKHEPLKAKIDNGSATDNQGALHRLFEIGDENNKENFSLQRQMHTTFR